MDQNNNNSQNEFLWTLLANPANDAHVYVHDLQQLVNDFPQSGILQALFAHASEEKNLRQASVYFNARSLFKLINAPLTIVNVPDEKIIIQGRTGTNGRHQSIEHLQTDENLVASLEENRSDNIVEPHFNADAVIETEAETTADEHHLTEAVDETEVSVAVEEPAEIEAAEAHQAIIPDTEPVHPEPESADEAENHVDETTAPVTEEATDYEPKVGHEEDQSSDSTPSDEHHLTEAVDETEEGVAVEEPTEIEAAEAHQAIIPDTEPVHPEPESADEAENHVDETTAPVTEEATDYEPKTGHEEDQSSNSTPSDEHHLTEAVDETEEGSAVEEPIENETTEAHENVFHDRETVQPEPESASSVNNEEFAETGTESHAEERILSVTEQEVPSFGDDLGEAPPPAAEATVIESIEHQPEEHIADETFDEIVSIDDINITSGANEPAASVPEAVITAQNPDPEAIAEDNLIKENIASTDFFMFDQAISEHKKTEQAETTSPVSATNTTEPDEAKSPATGDTNQQDVSKYNDEKMPYTFMWWLDKTRKEHTGVYQPYIKPESVGPNTKSKMAADELQQQYFENIFHITSIGEIDKGAAQRAAPFDTKRKEQVIIERFIKEEPQIKPQSSDKLDNENKARKSSEDRDELVTETLAGIYSDQMLYHKAIASYKKLMLKFPEKSRYFAAKIEQLEKKTN